MSTTASSETEIVYMCSPDRYNELLVSVGSLLTSGSTFDKVTVWVVNLPSEEVWLPQDRRIVVRPTRSLFGSYLYGNKLYLCRSRASRVVFLDTDTVVQAPIDEVWRMSDAEFVGRPASAMASSRWRSSVWRETFCSIGRRPLPMFNAGFMIFQRGVHNRVAAMWRRFISQYVRRELPFPFEDPRMPEQFALSLALASSNASCSSMSAREHAFLWCHDNAATAVVLHKGHHLVARHEASQMKSTSEEHAPAIRWLDAAGRDYKGTGANRRAPLGGEHG